MIVIICYLKLSYSEPQQERLKLLCQSFLQNWSDFAKYEYHILLFNILVNIC